MGKSLLGNGRDESRQGVPPSRPAEEETKMTEGVIYGNCTESSVARMSCSLFACSANLECCCQTEKKTGITQGLLGTSTPSLPCLVTLPKCYVLSCILSHKHLKKKCHLNFHLFVCVCLFLIALLVCTGMEAWLVSQGSNSGYQI